MDWYVIFGQWAVLVGLFTWNIIRTDGMRKELIERIDAVKDALIEHRIHGNGKDKE